LISSRGAFLKNACYKHTPMPAMARSPLSEGEVVNNRIVFDPDREQELRHRIYAIGRREGSTGFWFSTAPYEP
jgi:hypothetical protein